MGLRMRRLRLLLGLQRKKLAEGLADTEPQGVSDKVIVNKNLQDALTVNDKDNTISGTIAVAWDDFWYS